MRSFNSGRNFEPCLRTFWREEIGDADGKVKSDRRNCKIFFAAHQYETPGNLDLEYLFCRHFSACHEGAANYSG